jgi:hypothetical protein
MGIDCDVHWVLTPVVERIGPQVLWRAIVAPAVTSHGDVERTYLAVDTSRMTKKPEPPAQGRRWTIYKIAARQTWLGVVEAADEREAIETAAAEHKLPANKLIAVLRR